MQYPDTRSATIYAALTLSICAMIAMSSCTGCSALWQPGHTVAPSPIEVADGSMVIFTKSDWVIKASEVDIVGGMACFMTVNGTEFTPTGPWEIISSDDKAKVSNVPPGGGGSNGTIYATGLLLPNPPDDHTYGHGKKFDALFSPAKFTGAGMPTHPCAHCKIVITYRSSCP